MCKRKEGLEYSFKNFFDQVNEKKNNKRRDNGFQYKFMFCRNEKFILSNVFY